MQISHGIGKLGKRRVFKDEICLFFRPDMWILEGIIFPFNCSIRLSFKGISYLFYSLLYIILAIFLYIYILIHNPISRAIHCHGPEAQHIARPAGRPLPQITAKPSLGFSPAGHCPRSPRNRSPTHVAAGVRSAVSPC